MRGDGTDVPQIISPLGFLYRPSTTIVDHFTTLFELVLGPGGVAVGCHILVSQLSSISNVIGTIGQPLKLGNYDPTQYACSSVRLCGGEALASRVERHNCPVAG